MSVLNGRQPFNWCTICVSLLALRSINHILRLMTDYLMRNSSKSSNVYGTMIATDHVELHHLLDYMKLCFGKSSASKKKPYSIYGTSRENLFLNALDLTAPASDALLKNRKNAWVQLAGHPGSFAPAGPHTIWKRRLTKENNETAAYQALMNDSVRSIIPKFYREVEFNGDLFIEIEDLLQHFTDPSIMDIKMGTRTFLESEVKNPVLRKDLYEKMIKISPDEPTTEEHEQRAVTKLRYMQFRENGSSTATMGFRIEAIRMSGETPITDLKKVGNKEQVKRIFCKFIEANCEVRDKLLERIKEIRQIFASSHFFKKHEIIGSSLLLMYDHQHHANVWMIDFAKTLRVEGRTLNHRDPWVVGNHEDGYLFGLDKLIQVISELDLSETAEVAPSMSESASTSSEVDKVATIIPEIVTIVTEPTDDTGAEKT